MQKNVPNMLTRIVGKRTEKCEVAEQAKVDRIAYHQAHVKNGPVQTRTPMSNTRRAKMDRESFQRKARKRHISRFFDKQREIATLRGQLQAAGAIPYASENFRASIDLRINAVEAILRNYGAELDTTAGLYDEAYVTDAITAAQEHYDRLIAA